MTFDQWVISRLVAHGAYAGKIDDVPGRQMTAALKKFQEAEHLKVSGLADQATVNALRRDAARASGLVNYVAAPAVPKEPVWLRDARRYMGIKEIPGPKSNPVITGWAKRMGGWVASFYVDDDIPWCGLFVNNEIAVTLPNEPLLANPLGALNWNKFGTALDVPALGAILVFRRDGGGHVGFYVGEDETHYFVLGGNQSNSVSITRIAKSRLVGIRWPVTGPAPQGGRVWLSAAGVPTSKNEA